MMRLNYIYMGNIHNKKANNGIEIQLFAYKFNNGKMRKKGFVFKETYVSITFCFWSFDKKFTAETSRQIALSFSNINLLQGK